jgi:Cu-Zn family superoxide dismutase
MVKRFGKLFIQIAERIFYFIFFLVFTKIMNAICYFDAKLSSRRICGTITFSQKSKTAPVIMNLDLKNFRKNQVHAIHIHEFGNLSKGCHSTGKHFNPDNFVHGLLHKDHHAGDIMSNIETSPVDGSVRIKYKDHRISLFPGKYCILGRAIVIHQYPDDLGDFAKYNTWKYSALKKFAIQRGYNTEMKTHAELLSMIQEQSLQTGNAGGRMTCAVIGIDQ